MTLPDEEGLTPERVLSGLVLHYSVEWPVSIVLGPESLANYNRVFLFLLGVKRALWSLGQISAKELAARLRDWDEEENPEDDDDEEERLTPSLCVHRVLLLRSWLMHFVGSVHAYFMSRVLHSTELELRDRLRRDDGLDLDGILSAHDEHMARVSDRCFLHPTARALREAVDRVLGVCLRLSRLCRDLDLASFDVGLVECEATYARSHQFLASALGSITRRQNVPHLNGLSAALAHSCPKIAND